MLLKQNPVPLAYNGESHLIALVNSQLQGFVQNNNPVLVSGEKGIGKYRAATWVHTMRTGSKEKLPVVYLQSAGDLAQLASKSYDAAYLLLHENYAIVHLPSVLQLGIPLLYMGIISSQPFTLHNREVNTVHIPALRERVIDLPILIQGLIHRVAEEHNQPPKNMHETLIQQLQRKPLLGNMVELKFLLKKWLLTGELE